MNQLFRQKHDLVRRFRGETLRVSPCGKDGLRVTATVCGREESENVVLMQKKMATKILLEGNKGKIINGRMVCEITENGFLRFYDGEKLLLEELWEVPENPVQFSMKRVPAREYKAVGGGDYYTVTQRFAAYEGERFYGLGQRQCGYLDLKGSAFELAQRNSEVNIPFVLSGRGYGFFWNSAAVGRVELAKNGTVWTAAKAKNIDYYITCGSVAEIVENFTACVGRAPEMPECGTGFWASKLRYRTQDELLSAAHKYCELGMKPSVIVIDYFHWKNNGDWRFDERFWPDPAGMVGELRKMGIEVMVSIWPTLAPTSENYKKFKEKNYLVNTNRGSRIQMNLLGNLEFYDATNSDARKELFRIAEKNYLSYGIRYFWLDVAEPEILPYDFDNVRYYAGAGERVTNLYPYFYAKGFYDGLCSKGIGVMNLSRSAFAGSQKFGAAVWSGDIMSSFASLKNQIFCGVHMGISGIPWWTSDIGGFEGADNADSRFRELLVRWFEFGAFCPIFRLHGSRKCNTSRDGTDIGYDVLMDVWGENHRKAQVNMFRENEPWIYSPCEQEIFKKYISMREKLRPYIAEQMKTAHQTGLPVMRPLFMQYESDERAWTVDDEYMFGEDILVAPVYEEGARSRSVYLPQGTWIADTGEKYVGGRYEIAAPLERIPVFFRAGSDVCAIWEK